MKEQFAALAAAEVSPVTGPACPPLSALAQCQESAASAPAHELLQGGEAENQSEMRWKIMTDERKKNKQNVQHYSSLLWSNYMNVFVCPSTSSRWCYNKRIVHLVHGSDCR